MLGALRLECALHASGHREELAVFKWETTKEQRSSTGYWNWDATENIPLLVDGMITHNTSTMYATTFPRLTTSLFSLYIAFKSSRHLTSLLILYHTSPQIPMKHNSRALPSGVLY